MFGVDQNHQNHTSMLSTFLGQKSLYSKSAAEFCKDLLHPQGQWVCKSAPITHCTERQCNGYVAVALVVELLRSTFSRIV